MHTLAEQVFLWLLLTPSVLATLGLVASSVLVLIFVDPATTQDHSSP